MNSLMSFSYHRCAWIQTSERERTKVLEMMPEL